MKSAALSPTIIEAAFVFPEGNRGKMEESATRSPFVPLTFSLGLTTPMGSASGAILQLPDGC